MTGQLVSYGTGDDGDLQEGVGWPIPRFTDNGDGTIIDNLTGLIWLKDANCFGAKTWDESLPIANGLANGSCGLTDGSEVGDWRLPNRKELFSLVHDGYYNPCIPNTIGTGKWSPYDPFINVMSNYYWTSNVLNSNDIYAWSIHMYNGLVGDDLKSRNCYIWPVRNGNMHPSTTTTIPAPVPKSWMTISYSTGDDGYYQTGLGWETPRFTDNSNGTVNDNFTGLMWLQDIGQFGRITWEAAVDTCYNLDYAGYQDWRLPNVKELFSLTDYSQKRPRLPAGHPFTGYEGGHDWCWSSTTEFDSTANADVFSVGAGDVGAENKTTKLFKCWCVRGGQ